MRTILVVEDRDSMARMLEETLRGEGYRVLTAGDAPAALTALERESVDLLLTDLKLPGEDGLSLLRSSKEEDPLRPVIVMTAFGSVETAVSAMKEGAYDFITKPFNIDHLLVLIARALENRQLVKENMLLRDVVSGHRGLPDIIGNSQPIIDVAQQVQKVASARTTILLLGESGTGKELLARAIHHLSDRRDYPFVPINCAAIPKELLESELFGHERGAFTGADTSKPGKFELADQGTVFLDEVGELDTSFQAKLLRVIQEGEVERLGSSKTVTVDVRVVAATNRNLERALAEGRFREDLYYRLNVFPIVLPPLRERAEDIPLLVQHFIRKYAAELKMAEPDVSGGAMDALMSHEWRGNVRELENTIERALILLEGTEIKPEQLSLAPAERSTQGSALTGPLESVSRTAQRLAETRRIRKALEDAGGNKSKAAQELQVSYKTLLTKIRDYGIA